MLYIPIFPILLLLKSNSTIEFGNLSVIKEVLLLFNLLFLNYNLLRFLKWVELIPSANNYTYLSPPNILLATNLSGYSDNNFIVLGISLSVYIFSLILP